MKRIAIVFGTRPEVIKLYPVIAAIQNNQSFLSLIVNTGQHREMCDQAMTIFGIVPDVSLELMSKNQSPVDILAKGISSLSEVFTENKISGVIVQGDTTTALAATLAASYNKIPVAHVEAGLRTFDKENPFPEEINRLLIGQASTLHFAPTFQCAKNLANESIKNGVFVTGNTVVDSVHWVKKQISEEKLIPEKSLVNLLEKSSGKILLVTGHRREHFDKPIRNLCEVLLELLNEHPEMEVIYPVHLNPNIQGPVFEILGKTPRCHLLAPLDYPSMIFLMEKSSLIITDSGGMQEEAPSLQTPVIVTRKTTERSEALKHNVAQLCSLEEPRKLKAAIEDQLNRNQAAEKHLENPFGDATAGTQIAEILSREWA